uniref:Uncharacterized protein n=1 Tax=viral metagenome TaxID=1070528 RepID=A0A6M3JJ66_9ZZZZ
MEGKINNLEAMIIVFLLITSLLLSGGTVVVCTTWHLNLKRRVENLESAMKKPRPPSALYMTGDYPQVFAKGGEIVFLDRSDDETLKAIKAAIQ